MDRAVDLDKTALRVLLAGRTAFFSFGSALDEHGSFRG